MHGTDDVLVVGPLEPLFPRPLRVRLGVAVAGIAALVCAALIAALVVSLRIGLVPVSVPDALAQLVLQPAPKDWASRHLRRPPRGPNPRGGR
jgi:hypothetical protein